MLSNYLKTAIRNLFRNRVYTFINVFGLAVGLACCMIISMYVYDELSFDRFFADNERIYRIALERDYPDHTRFFASSSVMLAPTLMENYPEVEMAGRMHRLFFIPEVIVTIDENSYPESRFYFADSSLLQVLQFDFIEGDPITALNTPEKVILTQETAEKYFGNESAIGKTLETTVGELEVSAVVASLPSNSHMQFDLLGSMFGINYLDNAVTRANWTSPWLYTYVKLRENADPEHFQEQLDEIVEKYGAASIQNEVGISLQEYTDSGHRYKYFLQPITSIHLHSNLNTELQANSDVMYVYLLIVVVAFILVISAINFVNLSTARSGERAREVGIRKVMGSYKRNLIGQFLSESVIVSAFGLLVGGIFVWLTLPIFNSVLGKELDFFFLLQPSVAAGLVGFAILVGLLAGLYPAFYIASIEAASVLKGEYKGSKRGILLRNGLVVFQFLISIVLISGVLIVEKQLDYIRNRNLGFDKENILVIKQAGQLGEQWSSFRQEIVALPEVLNAGSTFIMPGGFFGSNIFQPDDPELPMLRANTLTVDDDYFETMDIQVAEGRYFDKDFNDSLSCVINEAAAKVLGWEDPVGRRLAPSNTGGGDGETPQFTIVGVLEDFNFQSLHSKVFPIVLFNGNSQFVPAVIAVRLAPGPVDTGVEAIRTKWNEMETGQEMIYSFLDEDLDQLYQAELTSKKIFDGFTVVAIIMACIGLFGLSTYVVQQRMKEIGVRKVMGASVTGIVLLLSRDLFRLILISLVIAIPISVYAIDRWLEYFAYRTEIGVFTFIIAGGLSALLAWVTISYQSIRAALLNPIKSIRDD